MIKLKKLTRNNYFSVVSLDAGDNGKYVSPNSETISYAFMFDDISNLLVIYNNDNVIGIIFARGKMNERIFINRFMIDKKYQGKGYGKKSLLMALKYFTNKYKTNKIYITSSNPIAIKLYETLGFVKTGKKYRHEFELKLLYNLL